MAQTMRFLLLALAGVVACAVVVVGAVAVLGVALLSSAVSMMPRSQCAGPRAPALGRCDGGPPDRMNRRCGCDSWSPRDRPPGPSWPRPSVSH